MIEGAIGSIFGMTDWLPAWESSQKIRPPF